MDIIIGVVIREEEIGRVLKRNRRFKLKKEKKNTLITRIVYLLPRVSFDLRKLELGVIRIHFANLFSGWCTQDFDNLHQLINARVTRKYGLTKKKFGQHASSTPDI